MVDEPVEETPLPVSTRDDVQVESPAAQEPDEPGAFDISGREGLVCAKQSSLLALAHGFHRLTGPGRQLVVDRFTASTVLRTAGVSRRVPRLRRPGAAHPAVCYLIGPADSPTGGLEPAMLPVHAWTSNEERTYSDPQ